MGLMAYIHRLQLRLGKLEDLLPDKDDLGSDKEEREAARADIDARTAEEEKIRQEVRIAVARLNRLNRRNHYGDSLRRAFGGR